MKMTVRTGVCVAMAMAGMTMGCRGGDGSGTAKSSCSSIGMGVNSVTTSGSVDNLPALADGNLGTFTTFTSGAPGNYVSSSGNNFPGGGNAGVFITRPAGATASDITISTFLAQEQTAVESATGPTLTFTPTQSDPSAEYVSFRTRAPYNGVRLQVNTPGNARYLVFEVCGAASPV